LRPDGAAQQVSERMTAPARRLDRAPALPTPLHAGASAPAVRRDVRWTLIRAIADTLALVLAAVVDDAAQDVGAGWHAAAVLLTLAAFAGAGSYLPRLRLSLGEELRRLLATSALVSAAIAAAVMLTGDGAGDGDAMVMHWLVVSTLVCGGRLGLYAAHRFARARLGDGGRTLIVGAGHVGRLTAQRLRHEPQLGLRPVGFLDKHPLSGDDKRELRGLPGLPVLGASWDLEDVVRTHAIDHVVVAFSTAPHHVLLGIVRRCWQLGVGVMVVPRLFEVEGRRTRIEHVGALPLVQLNAADPRGWQFAVKYALDRVLAALIMIALAPLFTLVALAVLVTMGRPVLFRQRRVGRDGRSFDMLKFRTMRGAPEEDGHANADWASIAAGYAAPPHQPTEDRRTPLGAMLRAFSIDELPQLWNVVRGEMSLVGPRPEMPHYVQLFEDAVYRYPDRHRVKSGLTGWAQVNGLRGDTSLTDRIEWDNFYIENWTLWLDLKILWLTLAAMFGRQGT
jgi:exopolysaccharide biosynthesis polyprenyl glycosylphosphotransferase